MSSTSKGDTIKAAMSLADDVAAGKLDPAELDQVAADECRALFGTVVGPQDPLWPLHVEVTRGVLAAGGVPANELSEWLAVQRRRDGVDQQPAASLLGVDQPPLDDEIRDAAEQTRRR